MKKFLPIIVLCLLFLAPLFVSSGVFAQMPPSSSWVEDPEVTFVGKAGARAGAFLDWTIRSYQWAEGASNLSAFWITIRNIVYAFLVLLVLVGAFVIIVTRGRNITVRQFVPRFIAIVLLVTLSFALVQFIYQATDVIQLFFLRKNDVTQSFISQKDLLYIGFNYENFVGYRLSGSVNDESAFMSLFLVKLTTITYYVMAGVLILRKIILWFFIIISPIFPLLILYTPVRNTAKIWFGEFLRWVLYAPLFSVFLSGLVAIWKTNMIPLNFGSVETGKVIYPTAINILLGGPGQTLAINNSVNLPETFALYVVGLIMLWVVMLLPFLLLQVFLDYLHNFQPSESTIIRHMISMGSTFFNKPVLAPISPAPATMGMAKTIPFGSARSIPLNIAKQLETPLVRSNPSTTTVNRFAETSIQSNRPVTTSFGYSQSQTAVSRQNQVTNSLLKTTHLSVPTLTDIARFETNTITNNNKETITKITETLQKIANPRLAVSSLEKEQFRTIRDQFIQQKQKGDAIASAVLTAATVATEARPSRSALDQIQTNMSGVISSGSFPVINRVQSVSLEDYESVKKMWQENYIKIDPPKTPDGKEIDRKQWISQDSVLITEAVNKLQSHDPAMVKEGMNMVSSVLPFLLIGGFSQTEIIAYLKAKLEAAKTTLADIDKKQDEESTLVDAEEVKQEKPKEMTASAEISTINSDDQNSNVSHE